ncbi:ABC transporter ATP-binding protein [Streptomyces sp. B6B3]|uniref:ABC transporter ATP-binding protein n=1 Tax=Streptomyces sp. B6B3 TaxID=3153570 RepID=UPI00325CE1A4
MVREVNPSGRRVLGRAVAGQRGGVAVGAVLGAGHQAGEALVPVLIGVVIDRGVAERDAGALTRWLVVLAVVYLALSFGFRFGARAAERAAERAAHALRMELVARVLHPAGGAERGRLPGALTSVAAEDTRRVGAVAMALPLGLAALSGLLVGAVVLLGISTALGLLVLLGTPVLLSLGHLLSKPLERRSAVEQERAAHASGVAADLVAGLRALKGLGAVPAAVARYRHTSRASLAATLRAARAEAWQHGMTTALTGLFIAVVALVGGRLAAEETISLGQLVSAVGLALFLIGPLQTLAYVNAELAQGRASATRIAEVLAAPFAVSAGGTALPGPDGRPTSDAPGAAAGVPEQRAATGSAGAVTGAPAPGGAPVSAGADGVPAGGAVARGGLVNGSPAGGAPGDGVQVGDATVNGSPVAGDAVPGAPARRAPGAGAARPWPGGSPGGGAPAGGPRDGGARHGQGSPREAALRLDGVCLDGLCGLDLVTVAGEVLGVAVAEPADAAVLVRCLGREVEPDAGSVELGGVPVATLDPAALRATLLVAAHDADLFAGTVAGNVADGAPEGADLAPALAAAGADEMLRSLPRGADQPVGERGGLLSGGQRQRVALARALAADPPILVLHDPTTAVDAVTEARVATGLRRLRTSRPDRTTVLVTTSPALLAVTDRVVFVAGGRPEAAGTHQELVERHASYRAVVLS